MKVKFGGIEFDNVLYDERRMSSICTSARQKTAVDWDESPEGHHLRFAADGAIVGITIVNARRTLEEDGKIVVTLPAHQIETSDLDAVLTPA